jgi:hypothetical protein
MLICLIYFLPVTNDKKSTQSKLIQSKTRKDFSFYMQLILIVADYHTYSRFKGWAGRRSTSFQLRNCLFLSFRLCFVFNGLDLIPKNLEIYLDQ